jgi:hypothetical protein
VYLRLFLLSLLSLLLFHEWQVEDRLDESKEQREE